MFLKLDYDFAPLSFFLENVEISFSTYFLYILAGLTLFHLTKTIQK